MILHFLLNFVTELVVLYPTCFVRKYLFFFLSAKRWRGGGGKTLMSASLILCLSSTNCLFFTLLMKYFLVTPCNKLHDGISNSHKVIIMYYKPI